MSKLNTKETKEKKIEVKEDFIVKRGWVWKQRRNSHYHQVLVQIW
jgi:hypothetical protein